MRTTKELLEIMLENIDRLRFGLCALALDLTKDNIINDDEFITLIDYIEVNREGNYYYDDADYFWKPRIKKPRKLWLERQIAHLDAWEKLEKINFKSSDEL
jgi:hypothetical protein